MNGAMGAPTDGRTPPGRQGLTDDERRATPWVLAALGGVVAIAVIVGFVLWIGGDDETATSPTTASLVSGSTLPTAGSTIDSSPATEPTEPSTPSTAAAPETTAATTEPDAPDIAPFALPEAGATSWTVPVFHIPDVSEMTLELATTVGDVRAYDGAVDRLRCVAVVGPGDTHTGWCGPNGSALRFVADRGIAAWLVEIGAESGDITMAEQDPSWSLPSNGCQAPMSVVLAAVAPGPFAVTDVVCAGDEAFVGTGSLLFGEPRAPDGGGILVGAGDEGWDVIAGFGTSIDCGGWPDGVDRCELFDVESELFEALLPVPPAVAIGESAVGVVGVTDRTADVGGWIGDETDPEQIASVLVDQLDDADAEVPADVRRVTGLQFGRLALIVVEIPRFDDAVRSETWAVWVGSLDETSGVTAFSWTTCARGVTGDGLCV